MNERKVGKGGDGRGRPESKEYGRWRILERKLDPASGFPWPIMEDRTDR